MDGQPEDRAPNPIDIHVGERIRRRRRSLGISQDRLAEEIGLTFQQVQKYERGANRVSASKLYQAARVLQAPVSYFFEGLPTTVPGVQEDAQTTFVHEMPPSPDEREVALLMSRIADKRVRKRLLELVRSLGEAPSPAAES